MFIPSYSNLKQLVQFVDEWNVSHEEKLDLDCLNTKFEDEVIKLLNKIKEARRNER